jgi:hypothetical protein
VPVTICPHCQQPIPENNEESWPSWEQFTTAVNESRPTPGLRVRLLNAVSLLLREEPDITVRDAFAWNEGLRRRHHVGVKTMDYAMNLVHAWRRRQ